MRIKVKDFACAFSSYLIIFGWITTASSDKFSPPDNHHNFETLNQDDKEDTFSRAYEEFRTFDSFGSGGDSSFVKPRLYNTSIALTASMFSYYVPGQADAGSVSDLVNQAVYGLFGTLAVSLIYAVPVLLTGVMYNPSTVRSIDGEEASGWITSPIMKIENVRKIFNEEFRDEIGLDYKKCLQKTICEAHRSPKNKKYGLLALPFQMFFPPIKKNVDSSFTARAAAEGSFTKKDCGKRYNCFFDTLELATFLIDWYRLRNDEEYEPDEIDL